MRMKKYYLRSTNLHVVKQGCGIPDARWDALFIGRQLLKLPQKVPQSLQLKSSQHMFKSAKLSCIRLSVFLLEFHILNFRVRVIISTVAAILIVGFQVSLGQT